MTPFKNIFMIGPGGVGKSTVGRTLSEMLGFGFIDLDQEFYNRYGRIGTFIDSKGYDSYCRCNSALFFEILKGNPSKTVFALSSGFLVHENNKDLIEKHKQALKENGISVLLLPSESIEESERIVIDRQLLRGYELNEEREKEKFRSRFPKYLPLGDIKIFSSDLPDSIAETIKRRFIEFNTEKNGNKK